MSFGAFFVAACVAVVAVVVVTPAVSFVFLKKERERIAEFSRHKPIGAIFFTEILLWVAAVCVAGFLLTLFLFLIVFSNAHASGGMGVPRDETVPLTGVAVIFTLIGGLAFVGFLLHGFTASKLIEGTSDSQNLLSLNSKSK